MVNTMAKRKSTKGETTTKKYSTENLRSRNTNPTKNLGCCGREGSSYPTCGKASFKSHGGK
jgi:hypothetical protein